MGLLESLLLEALRERLDHGPILSFVGAGGKTSSIFRLAREAVDKGWSVLVTTTTRMWDPRSEKGRLFDRLVLASSLPAPAPGLTILGSLVEAESGKLVGLEPRALDGFTFRGYDLVLVEADGSRGLPVKAPASHEPAIPVSSDLVLGLIGLDCLGSPATAATVHRLETFLALTGAREGEPLSCEHLSRLVSSPEGLFRNSPEAARRVLILNKADLVPEERALGLKSYIEAVAASDAHVSDVLIASNR